MTEIKVKYFCPECKKYYDPSIFEGDLFVECEPYEYERLCPVDNIPLQWNLI